MLFMIALILLLENEAVLLMELMAGCRGGVVVDHFAS